MSIPTPHKTSPSPTRLLTQSLVLSVRPPRVDSGGGGGGACEASPLRYSLQICHSCRLFPLAAARDHTNETHSPGDKGGGDEEGRRGWRWPGSGPAAVLGSAPPRGHSGPRPAAPRRIADHWAGDGAAAAGAGVGDRGGGVRGGPGRGRGRPTRDMSRQWWIFPLAFWLPIFCFGTLHHVSSCSSFSASSSPSSWCL